MTVAVAAGRGFNPPGARPEHQFADVVVVHRNPLLRAGIAAALSPALLACDAGTEDVPRWSGPVRPRLLVADHEGAVQALVASMAMAGTESGGIPSGGIPSGGIPSGDIPSGDIPSGDIPSGDIHWLVVTPTINGRRVRQALKAGVTGYIHSSCQLEELREAACAVAAGRRYLCRKAAAALADGWTDDALTPREADVLEMLCLGLDNKSIGRKLGVAPGTIKTHVRTLMQKLCVHSRTQAVMEAMRRGLLEDVFAQGDVRRLS